RHGGGCGGPDGRAAPNVDYAPGRCIGPRFGEPSMIRNLIGPDWRPPADGAASLPVFNPATGEVIEQVPLSGERDVAAAVAAATSAYSTWSRTPLMERVRLMFRYKAVLEEHFEDLASIITLHHGKTLDESRGEVRRGIEVVDFACGAPTLLQGRTLRDVSGGVDQDLYRYPVGVCAGIPPFNFPVMIPLWMFPLAVVAGNTFVLKPSERTPLGGQRLAELFLEAGFPAGVLNVVPGAAGAVAVGKAADILLDPLRDAASKMVVGPGDQPGVQVGPLIRAEHRDRVASYVEKGTAEGAQLVVDGRGEMSRQGFFLGPTILDRVTPQMAVGREEIFGPVLSVARAATLEDAIAQANASSLGNMATIFTQSGRAGREFRE